MTQTASAEAKPSGGSKGEPPREVSPVFEMALMFLVGRSAEKREEIARWVCDTLGAYPRFWRCRELEDEEPNQAGCVVKIQAADGNPVPRYQLAAWDEETRLWKSLETQQTIAGVVAWAILPV